MKTKLIMMAFAAVLILTGAPVSAEEPQYLTYDEFIRRVDAGNIKEVRLGEPSYAAILGKEIIGGKTNEFRCWHAGGASDDPLLIRLLKEKGVTVSIQTTKDERGPFAGAMISGLTMMLVPLVTLVFVILIHLRLRKLAKEKAS
ncbi:MAG: ATP-dependent metallopeptidase FtsH/Yme1/Tma family protein [Verrucomicrobiia bacterium]